MIGSGLPKRKNIRLSGYDYSQNGAYFITICTKDKNQTFGDIAVGAAALGGPRITLSHYGQIAERYIKSINEVYQGISVPVYCIMPNHVHFIVVIDVQTECKDGSPSAATPTDNGLPLRTDVAQTGCESGSPSAATPTIPKIVNSLKTLATKEAGQPIWQRGYYEHIIRNEQDYLDIWNYIETNAVKWAEDKYYL